MTLRVMPTIGAEVFVEHLGVVEHGIVHRVAADGRSVEVALAQDGRLQLFVLNRATARFTAGGQLTGARLRFARDA